MVQSAIHSLETHAVEKKLPSATKTTQIISQCTKQMMYDEMTNDV